MEGRPGEAGQGGGYSRGRRGRQGCRDVEGRGRWWLREEEGDPPGHFGTRLCVSNEFTGKRRGGRERVREEGSRGSSLDTQAQSISAETRHRGDSDRSDPRPLYASLSSVPGPIRKSTHTHKQHAHTSVASRESGSLSLRPGCVERQSRGLLADRVPAQEPKSDGQSDRRRRCGTSVAPFALARGGDPPVDPGRRGRYRPVWRARELTRQAGS